MKKLAIIGTVGLPARYGGFETLAENLVDNLSDTYEITVYCSGKTYAKEERVKTFKGAKLVYVPFKANGIQSIVYDYLSILHAAFKSDVLLILGVSGCTLLPLIRLFTRKKIIVNIDGLEWRRKKWSKAARFLLKLSEKIAVKYSHVDVADNNAIQRYTTMYYGTLSHVIEYGGDHAKPVPKTPDLLLQYPFIRYEYCMTVARIEPENNIHIILDAFSKIDRRLLIVGNWDYSDYGRDLKAKYAGSRNIRLLDPIYKKEVINALRSNAAAYIHGHEAGGTNPSLVEAMCLGLPIIAFNVSFNKETTEFKAHYFSDSDQLVSVLSTITEEDLRTNAEVMKAIADRRYQWSHIATKYHRLVNMVTNGFKKKRSSIQLSPKDKYVLRMQGVEHLMNTKYYFELTPGSHE